MADKAVLVFDMPKTCGDCPLMEIADKDDFEDNHCFCSVDELVGDQNIDRLLTFDNKPFWCPLKPLPEKNKISNLEEFMNECGWMSDIQKGMDIGWNNCINEITGESK